ncbi:hypothetical protein BKA62DRAFT_833721 [Auriculariales sp. MPI-PUGE-AT-0066]|nr:hypothetical protein BKA62DRAFT_833721 [Auriculariales sp. MPI-PUGE-AT-0066]
MAPPYSGVLSTHQQGFRREDQSTVTLKDKASNHLLDSSGVVQLVMSASPSSLSIDNLNLVAAIQLDSTSCSSQSLSALEISWKREPIDHRRPMELLSLVLVACDNLRRIDLDNRDREYIQSVGVSTVNSTRLEPRIVRRLNGALKGSREWLSDHIRHGFKADKRHRNKLPEESLRNLPSPGSFIRKMGLYWLDEATILKALELVPHVEHLNISIISGVISASDDQLPKDLHLPRLRKVEFYDYSVVRLFALIARSAIPTLREVDMDIDQEHLISVFRQHASDNQVTHLNMANCRPKRFDPAKHFVLPYFPRLQQLEISDCPAEFIPRLLGTMLVPLKSLKIHPFDMWSSVQRVLSLKLLGSMIVDGHPAVSRLQTVAVYRPTVEFAELCTCRRIKLFGDREND